MSPISAHTIIAANYIACVDQNMRLLRNHAIVIARGKIVAIEPSEDIGSRYTGEIIKRDFLIPGLINAHGHIAMSLLRGLADDLALMQWLEQHIWPAENKHVSAQFVADGSRLAIGEMLLSGTTCFADMYYFPDIVGSIAEDIGMRAAIGLIAIDAPSAWAQSSDEYLSKAAQVFDQFKHSELISSVLMPHAPYSTSDDTLIKMRALKDELGICMQMHVHETEFEVQTALTQSGMRPLQRLQQLGMLTPDFMAVHMCALDAADIELIASHHCHVVHCPQSNMKLASGICPLDQLLTRGINVALGTDGAASNNDLNMLAEMQTAALLAKLASGEPSALPAATVLQMATINGARALGLEHITGSLEVGKAADIVAIDFDSLHTQPTYDPIAQLIYSGGRDNVRDVWVNGQALVKNRQLTGLNQQQLINNAKAWRTKIMSSPNNSGMI